MKFWDEWRGTNDGQPTFWLKRLLHWRGYWLDLHKFVGADDPGCFHSHPAHAVRIVLWGGYTEEVLTGPGPIWVTCKPGHVGYVAPAYVHRIQCLLNGRASWSLWFRGPVIAKTRLIGWGWPIDALAQGEGA